MIFESMWPAALLLTVPVVIILYLLKPRGRDYRISSILLWDKLFHNQQSRTFLEKFIHNILMYLQILILVLMVLSLMSPYIRREGKNSGNVILVFDESGSMQHDAGDGITRMEKALKQAKSFIAASEETAFSIVTNDCAGTEILAVRVKDKDSLSTALDQVSCCDGAGNLADAVSLVDTLRVEEEDTEEGSAGTEVIVFTDGNGAEAAVGFSEYFDAQVIVLGNAVSNVSNNFLTYTEAENVPETEDGTGDEEGVLTEDVSVITCASSLTNYSDAEASMEVSLYAGEQLLEMKQLRLAPDETSLCFFDAFRWRGEPLRSEISSIKFAGKAERDSLADDNTAYAVKEQSGITDAVLVGEGNTYLEKAYQAAMGKSLTKVAGEYGLQDGVQAVRIYDAGTKTNPEETVSALVFQDAGRLTGTAEKVMLTVTDCELTAGLSSFTVGVNETNLYEIPSWGKGFLWAGDQCAGYYGEHDGVKTIVVGFDIRESDFPLKAEFPVFVANAVGFLGDTSLLMDNVYEAGDTVLFHPQADFDVGSLMPETKKAGLYELAAGDVTEQYVVRFAAGNESDGRLTGEGTVPETSYSSRLVKRQLRNALLVLILFLLAVEWILYVRQTRCKNRFYFGVRAVGFLLLILALFGVSVRRRDAVNTTVFLVDISNSNEQNLPAMEEYLRDILGKMPKKNQYGIVTFGKNSLVEQFLTNEDHFTQIMSLPDKEATNFEDAFSRALTMIPADGAGRIVVLTDGRETKGNLAKLSSALLSGQVELLARVYETQAGQDAYVENVELPAYLYQEDLYSMTVTVESNYETDARLQIWTGDVQREEYAVHLNRGTNQFRFRQEVTGENVESFEVRVAADGDTCGENNSFHAYSVVDAAPKVLLVTGAEEDSSQYEELLSAAGCVFDTAYAAGAPDTLEKLLEYKSILLENVYLSDLPDGFLENIETYVKDYGCGLVCIGGEDSFALGGYRESVLETVLPVDMELRGVDEIPTTVMIMVIDHSGSMSMDAGSGATNLDLAVTAAKMAVDQMRSTDYVGVVTFDDTFSWVVEPTSAENKEEIKAQIETIAEGGGTTIGPALRAALEGAEGCEADIRHVVLLTDGQGESRRYSEITDAYQAAEVTLSAVAVGEDADARLLERLAKDCGGRYYYSDMATDIPKIFAQEVFLSGDTYLQNGTFALAVDGSDEITEGLFEEGWPGIYGYVSATPKGASHVLIASEKDDPLLTTMQYGLGHTVAWNTDVTNKWTAEFAGKSDYVQLWRRIVDYSVGNVSIGEDSMEVAAEGGYTNVVYHALDYDGQTKVEAVYTDPAGNTQTAPLQASAPGRFEAKLDMDATGLYNLSVRRLDGGNIVNAVTTAVAVQYSDEYKFDVDAASFTNFVERYGAMLDPEENIWRQRKSEAKERYELTKWLLVLLIFWFVMDIALRRFYILPQDTRLYQSIAGYWRKRRLRRAQRAAGHQDAGRKAWGAEEESMIRTGMAAGGVENGAAGDNGDRGMYSGGYTGNGTDGVGGYADGGANGNGGYVGSGTDNSAGAVGRVNDSNSAVQNVSAEVVKTDVSAGADTSGKKKKQRKTKEANNKEEAQTLDTSALLRKKDQRKQ